VRIVVVFYYYYSYYACVSANVYEKISCQACASKGHENGRRKKRITSFQHTRRGGIYRTRAVVLTYVRRPCAANVLLRARIENPNACRGLDVPADTRKQYICLNARIFLPPIFRTHNNNIWLGASFFSRSVLASSPAAGGRDKKTRANRAVSRTVLNELRNPVALQCFIHDEISLDALRRRNIKNTCRTARNLFFR